MRSAHALVIVCLLFASCRGYSAEPAVAFVERNSFGECPAVASSEVMELRKAAAKFFLANVGAAVSNVRIGLASRCKAETLFAISVDDAEFKAPFLVRVDNESGKMELIRPL
jgi:hypothetical protein